MELKNNNSIIKMKIQKLQILNFNKKRTIKKRNINLKQ